jgi:DNA-binding MarR family transcriptional regulator
MAKRSQTETEALADRLHGAAIRLLRLVRVKDTATGIAPARLSALSVIVFGGPISLRDLARAEQVKPPTMSRIVNALETEGLARRRVNKQDRRALLIESTKKGAAALHAGRMRRVRFLAFYLSRLANSELADIDRAVRSIHKALGEQ